MSEAGLSQQFVIQDGYKIDVETGEIIEVVDAPKKDPKQMFQVDDEDSAKWVLKRMLEAQSKADAVMDDSAVIYAQAVIANAAKLRKPHEDKVKFLQAMFGQQIIDIARRNLSKETGRTWKCLFGSVSFTKTQPNVAVSDQAAAVKYLSREAPTVLRMTLDLDALTAPNVQWAQALIAAPSSPAKVEIQQSKLKEIALAFLSDVEDSEATLKKNGIDFVPAGENAKIKVGA